ncbi:MAG: DUF2007 domain-containing protein [Flavobacteriaceae bacterium]|jgi:hypothetical protein|nr:DUF2007 domain-containing protein [Flavobacteriaceae bacterium]HTO36131.1 DUF2007 domain-containing protein [Flavobacterium sp.]
MEQHIKVFSGSQVESLTVRNVLENDKIEYVVRDDIQSAITAGYGGLDRAVNIFVSKENYDRARRLIEKLESEEELDDFS